MAKVAQVYAAAGRAVPAETENKLTLELASGSRIVALPGSERTTRGYSAPALIIIDEASRVDDEALRRLDPHAGHQPGGAGAGHVDAQRGDGLVVHLLEEGGALVGSGCASPPPSAPASPRPSWRWSGRPCPPRVRAGVRVRLQPAEAGAFRYEDVMAMLSDDIGAPLPA